MIGSIAIHIVGLLARLVRAMAVEARARRAERQLEALDHRMLRDMGIDRGQIAYAVRRRPVVPETPVRPLTNVVIRGIWQRN